MASILLYTLISVFLVSLVSFVGVISISTKILHKQKILLFLVSLSAGTLFGGVFFHLLPEALKDKGYTFFTASIVLAGILTFFVLEKVIHWHHCHGHFFQDKKHTHDKEHTSPKKITPNKQSIAWLNLLGDGVHNFTDGLVIAGSYLVNIPTGIATTIAVIIHEIPQEFADFGVLIYSGFSIPKALFLNFLSALVAVLGAVIGIFFASKSPFFLSLILPFAAGGFLYIAGSNLIPELHKDCTATESFWHFIALILGMLLMLALTFLE